MKKVLITGCAGFIGYHVVVKLLNSNFDIIGVDNLNNYYDINLKKKRLKMIEKISSKSNSKFNFHKLDISNESKIKNLFVKKKFDYVIHLAAQAGVRHSLEAPLEYIKSNIKGFVNILEGSKETKIKHLIYASTSSVYGSDKKTPYKESQGGNHPIQLYAVTKRSNELFAHAYSHLFNLPTTGLRFFTVYGPWGRPDMAIYKFTEAIIKNKKIDVYNKGRHSRDFTHVYDIAESISRLMLKIPKKTKYHVNESDISESNAPFRVLNIGNNYKVDLMYLIKLIENNLKKDAKKNMLPMQLGDAEHTLSNTKKLEKIVRYRPKIKIEEGIKEFIDWYKSYHGVINDRKNN